MSRTSQLLGLLLGIFVLALLFFIRHVVVQREFTNTELGGFTAVVGAVAAIVGAIQFYRTSQSTLPYPRWLTMIQGLFLVLFGTMMVLAPRSLLSLLLPIGFVIWQAWHKEAWSRKNVSGADP